MDSKKVNALFTALEYGSLTAAAQQLGYTQAGMTNMMNSLEEELGLSLLVRGKSGVHLSSDGQTIQPELRNFLSAAQELERRAKNIKNSASDGIRVGTYSSVARQWLPQVLSDFADVHPETEVSVVMGGIVDSYEMVKKAEVDCAFVSYQSTMMKSLAWTPLHDDELLAILSEDYSLEGDAFPVAAFSGESFIMPSLGFDLDINPVFNSTSGKISPRTSYTNMDDASVVSMVKHGFGISILSRMVLEGMADGIKAVSIAPAAYRRIGIIADKRRMNDKNIRHFIESTKRSVRDMYGSLAEA